MSRSAWRLTVDRDDRTVVSEDSVGCWGCWGVFVFLAVYEIDDESVRASIHMLNAEMMTLLTQSPVSMVSGSAVTCIGNELARDVYASHWVSGQSE